MRAILAAAAAGLLMLLYMMLLASSDPVIRYARYRPPGWPIGRAAQRLVLITDVHVSGPDMTPVRLTGIVRRINRLRPDIVLLGGDFTSGKIGRHNYGAADAVRPLAGLRATAGVVAVMGNHDHATDPAAVRRALALAGIRLLDNAALRLGPIAIGGVDDPFSGHADIAATAARLKLLGGVPILLSHSPDIFPNTPRWLGLVLAGHTHCGQIAPPLIGPIFTASRFGRRYACGLISEAGHNLIVSAGIGTSLLPLRLGARPDIWVIDVGR